MEQPTTKNLSAATQQKPGSHAAAGSTAPASEEALQRAQEEKNQQDALFDAKSPKGSVLQEKYEGTGPIISGLGYGAIESKVGMLLAAPLGILASMVMPESITKMHNGIVKYAQRAKDPNESVMVRVSAGFTSIWSGLTEWAGKTTTHTVDFVSELFTKEKVSTRVPNIKTYGHGIAHMTGLGLIASIVLGAMHGVSSSKQGKDQFDRAKDEIRTLRRQNNVLEEELTDATRRITQDKALHNAKNITPANQAETRLAMHNSRSEAASTPVKKGPALEHLQTALAEKTPNQNSLS